MKTQVLQFGQKLVSSDKTAVASAIVGGLTILAAKFGFRMNGADVAYLSAGVMGGLGVFVHAHFANQAPKVPPAPAAVPPAQPLASVPPAPPAA